MHSNDRVDQAQHRPQHTQVREPQAESHGSASHQTAKASLRPAQRQWATAITASRPWTCRRWPAANATAAGHDDELPVTALKSPRRQRFQRPTKASCHYSAQNPRRAPAFAANASLQPTAAASHQAHAPLSREPPAGDEHTRTPPRVAQTRLPLQRPCARYPGREHPCTAARLQPQQHPATLADRRCRSKSVTPA